MSQSVSQSHFLKLVLVEILTCLLKEIPSIVYLEEYSYIIAVQEVITSKVSTREASSDWNWKTLRREALQTWHQF